MRTLAKGDGLTMVHTTKFSDRQQATMTENLSRCTKPQYWVSVISIGDAMPANPWHHGIMPNRSSAKRDFVEVARGIVERAIGQRWTDGGSLFPNLKNTILTR
jgi:hypothetical protein